MFLPGDTAVNQTEQQTAACAVPAEAAAWLQLPPAPPASLPAALFSNFQVFLVQQRKLKY